MSETEFTDADRAEAYEYARQKVAAAKAERATSLDLDPAYNEDKTKALSAIPLEITNLGALTSLDFRNTQVSDLAPLQGLSGLQVLTLNNTQVSDLSPLSAHPALRLIRFDATHVADLSVLLTIPNLRIAAEEENIRGASGSGIHPLPQRISICRNFRNWMRSLRAVAR